MVMLLSQLSLKLKLCQNPKFDHMPKSLLNLHLLIRRLQYQLTVKSQMPPIWFYFFGSSFVSAHFPTSVTGCIFSSVARSEHPNDICLMHDPANQNTRTNANCNKPPKSRSRFEQKQGLTSAIKGVQQKTVLMQKRLNYTPFMLSGISCYMQLDIRVINVIAISRLALAAPAE